MRAIALTASIAIFYIFIMAGVIKALMVTVDWVSEGYSNFTDEEYFAIGLFWPLTLPTMVLWGLFYLLYRLFKATVMR